MDILRRAAYVAARSTFFSRATRSFVAFRSSATLRECTSCVHDWRHSSYGIPPSDSTRATCSCGVRSWNGESAIAWNTGESTMPLFALARGVRSPSSASMVSKASTNSSCSSPGKSGDGDRSPKSSSRMSARLPPLRLGVLRGVLRRFGSSEETSRGGRGGRGGEGRRQRPFDRRGRGRGRRKGTKLRPDSSIGRSRTDAAALEFAADAPRAATHRDEPIRDDRAAIGLSAPDLLSVARNSPPG
jgi:hypothetical protein